MPVLLWPWSGPLRGPLFGLAPDGVFRAPGLTTGAVGSYPAFSPLPAEISNLHLRLQTGGLFSVALSVGTPRGVASRVYPRPNRGYAASRPLEFGLSSLAAETARAILRPSKIDLKIILVIAYRKGGKSRVMAGTRGWV